MQDRQHPEASRKCNLPRGLKDISDLSSSAGPRWAAPQNAEFPPASALSFAANEQSCNFGFASPLIRVGAKGPPCSLGAVLKIR